MALPGQNTQGASWPLDWPRPLPSNIDRRLRRPCSVSGSLLTGIWPYLRNLVWTGDPVFPFLTKTLYPERINLLALNDLLLDTGASQSHHLGRLVPFVFFAGIRPSSRGFWDFFAPIVFAHGAVVDCGTRKLS